MRWLALVVRSFALRADFALTSTSVPNAENASKIARQAQQTVSSKAKERILYRNRLSGVTFQIASAPWQMPVNPKTLIWRKIQISALSASIAAIGPRKSIQVIGGIAAEDFRFLRKIENTVSHALLPCYNNERLNREHELKLLFAIRDIEQQLTAVHTQLKQLDHSIDNIDRALKHCP